MKDQRSMKRMLVFLLGIYVLGYFAGCFNNRTTDREAREDAAFQRELERPGNAWDFTRYITDQHTK